jgi:aspartate kinase
MKIFKFGGASVKDAESVKNLTQVLSHYENQDLVIVVSAMGKTTNALEKLVRCYKDDPENCSLLIDEIKEYHLNIIESLFTDKTHSIYNQVEILFSQLRILTQGKMEGNYNQIYDHIVSFGELVSTRIISSFLNENGYENSWLDARRLIRTDQNFRFARVNWDFTKRLVHESVQSGRCYVTQGFIGSDDDLNPTTLGREGSDYSASVLAFVLDAEEVIIWKDVPGVLNGDPKVFEETKLLNKISYKEAIELAYYGASVIHPKTIQPLQQKNIPLKVKSFMNPELKGTGICEGETLSPYLPCFILKKDQILVTLATRDLSFVVEDHLSQIYRVFHHFGARVNLSQNTAVSSSFCLNNDPVTTPSLLEELSKHFTLSYNDGVSLYTVRHYDDEAKTRVQKTGDVLLEQISRNTYQVVTV